MSAIQVDCTIAMRTNLTSPRPSRILEPVDLFPGEIILTMRSANHEPRNGQGHRCVVHLVSALNGQL